ncbi:MAG: hypothetical protein NTY46_00290, partial [Candidatus Sumerlaeota bacterium]|nr:hypothetical protein [Candidatus Sumerlaeota bacterium]
DHLSHPVLEYLSRRFDAYSQDMTVGEPLDEMRNKGGASGANYLYVTDHQNFGSCRHRHAWLVFLHSFVYDHMNIIKFF